MKIKPEKIALIIIACILSIIVIGSIVFGIIHTKENDYKFQQLYIRVEEGYFNDIVYEESTRTLNATLNVRMHFANQTNKEIGIDTNILSLQFQDPNQSIHYSESFYLNDRKGFTTTVGDYLGENQYQIIKANDVSVVKFSIPVTISFTTDNTNKDLQTKLSNLTMYWYSNYYFNQDGYRKIYCTASYNINRI